MIKLRKISDGVFQEAEHPEDRSRPLEWRRRFNFIILSIKNIKIVTSCRVHDADCAWYEERITDPLNLVKPDVSEQVAITGVVDEDQIRDQIYCAVEDEEEENIYSVERVAGQTNVSIEAGAPSEETEQIPAGLYRGSAFLMNSEPGENGIYFELTIPKEQLLSLISALRADSNSTVEVRAYLLSFTYEVDDALSEPYHPQDIIIINKSPCFVFWASVTSKIGQHYVSSDSEYEDQDEVTDIYQEELTPEQRSHQELLQALQSYSRPLNSLVTAVWVLIIVIALYAFLG